jgi:hypothetical protein
VILLCDRKQLFQPGARRLDAPGFDNTLEREVAILVKSLALAGSEYIHGGEG